MADIYVATTGSDTTGNGSSGNPYATIAKAATVVAAGDTIHVGDGDYQGSIWLNTDSNHTINTADGTSLLPITLLSTNQFGAKIKALSATGAGSGNNAALEVRVNYWIIDGLEVDGSGGYTGSGTTWTIGGTEWNQGIYVTGGHNIIQNCKVHDVAHNLSVGGSGIAIDTLVVGGGLNNIIRSNRLLFIGDGTGTGWGTKPHGHGIYNAAPGGTAIYNNLVGPVACDGIEDWHGATGELIYNNTVFKANNGIVVGSGDGGATVIANVRIFNNICYDCEFGITEFTGAGGSVGAGNLFDTNMAYGSTTANWSLSVDTHSNDVAGPPGFVNYQADGSGDYTLLSSSNAVDAGLSTLSGVAAPADDFDGNARPLGAGFDLGAYEYVPPAPPPPTTVYTLMGAQLF